MGIMTGLGGEGNRDKEHGSCEDSHAGFKATEVTYRYLTDTMKVIRRHLCCGTEHLTENG